MHVVALDKAASIWDVYYHSRPDKANGDVADDSFHKFMDDVAMLKALKVTNHSPGFFVYWVLCFLLFFNFPKFFSAPILPVFYQLAPAASARRQCDPQY